MRKTQRCILVERLRVDWSVVDPYLSDFSPLPSSLATHPAPFSTLSDWKLRNVWTLEHLANRRRHLYFNDKLLHRAGGSYFRVGFVSGAWTTVPHVAPNFYGGSIFHTFLLIFLSRAGAHTEFIPEERQMVLSKIRIRKMLPLYLQGKQHFKN